MAYPEEAGVISGRRYLYISNHDHDPKSKLISRNLSAWMAAFCSAILYSSPFLIPQDS